MAGLDFAGMMQGAMQQMGALQGRNANLATNDRYMQFQGDHRAKDRELQELSMRMQEQMGIGNRESQERLGMAGIDSQTQLGQMLAGIFGGGGGGGGLGVPSTEVSGI